MPMTSEPFFDTNVVIYLVSSDARKSGISAGLLDAGGLVSVQVLNEYARVLRRKFKRSWKQVRDASESLREACDVVANTDDVHVKGLNLAERYKLDVHDAMILATAILSGCTILYSEDMQHGQTIEGLTITNPFKTT